MAIQVGDKCPSFRLPDQHGNSFSIDDLLGKKIIVLYFYPKNNTGGCTAEACSFRDSYEAFDELGCEVIGVSGDSIESQEKFAAQHRLNFTLLSDRNKEVRRLFGVPKNLFGLIPGRVTYVIDQTGTVRSIHNSLSDPEGHIRAAMATVQSLTNS